LDEKREAHAVGGVAKFVRGSVVDLVVAVIATLVLAQFIDGRLAFVVGGVGFVAFRMWRRVRSSVRALWAEQAEEAGLTPELAKTIRDRLNRGGREASNQELAAVQEKQRAQLADAGFDSTGAIPLIGREIQWSDVVRHVFRVRGFDRIDTKFENDQVTRPAGKIGPYGYLLVESPIIKVPATLPINHRDDFVLAAHVFDDPRGVELVEQAELLVTYAPKNLLPSGLASGAWHVFHYVIVPRGTLDRYYSFDNDIDKAKPAPERLFGVFVYEGQISVKVNQNPPIE
jgi:hypothetical protein